MSTFLSTVHPNERGVVFRTITVTVLNVGPDGLKFPFERDDLVFLSLSLTLYGGRKRDNFWGSLNL